MRKFMILFVLAAIVLTCGAPSETRGEIIDRIVASVNGDIITLRELETRLEPFIKANNVTDPKSIKMAQEMLLEVMIQRLLVIQEGERLGFKVTDKEVNAFIENTMAQKGLTRAQLDRELHEKGGNLQSFRHEIRSELMKKKIIQWELALFIVITDEEVDQYVNMGGMAAVSQEGSGPKVALRAIVLNLPDNPSESVVKEKEKRARDIVEQIKGGLDFATAATKYSEAQSAKQGGDIGEMSLKETSLEVREAVEFLKEGDISQPVRIGSTISIFQVVKFVKEGERTVETTSGDKSSGTISEEEREEIRRTLNSKKLEKKYESWLKEVRSKAVIKIDL